MLRRILDLVGGLDIFHANAGAYVGGAVADGDPDDWDRVLNLNINAAFRSVHAVLPQMIERKTRRHRLHQFSCAVIHPGDLGADLHRLEICGASLLPHDHAARLARHGIRMGAVVPGPVVSPLLDDWPKAKMEEALAAGA